MDQGVAREKGGGRRKKKAGEGDDENDQNKQVKITKNIYCKLLVSVHRMVITENRPVDPDNIHGSHRRTRNISHEDQIHNTRERPSLNFVHPLYISETKMYQAACKVEFQPFNRSYSQLTCFN